MSNLTAEQIAALAPQLGGIAAIFNPGSAAAIGGLVQVGTQLFAMLQQIKANDPEMWAKVSADYRDAVAGFEASVQARKAQSEG